MTSNQNAIDTVTVAGGDSAFREVLGTPVYLYFINLSVISFHPLEFSKMILTCQQNLKCYLFGEGVLPPSGPESDSMF